MESVGKTTIISHLVNDTNIDTIKPTIGCKIWPLPRSRVFVWELSGKKETIPFWKCYTIRTNGIIFVFDSTDLNNFDYSVQLLKDMAEIVKTVPILILVNKKSDDKVVYVKLIENMDLAKRKWKIFETNIEDRTTINEAFKWLLTAVTPTGYRWPNLRLFRRR